MKGVSCDRIEFEVTIPKKIFRVLGIIYMLAAGLLALFLGNRSTHIGAGLYAFCICVAAIGGAFFVIPLLWKIEVYKNSIVICRLVFRQVVDIRNITEVRITLANSIEIWNADKRLTIIDTMCNKKRELLKYLKKNNIVILEK